MDWTLFMMGFSTFAGAAAGLLCIGVVLLAADRAREFVSRYRQASKRNYGVYEPTVRGRLIFATECMLGLKEW